MTEERSTGRLRVEVAYALPGEQALVALEVVRGTTVQQAIERSQIANRFPGEDLAERAVGIWGRRAERSEQVGEGDRIEIYRELAIDPREARRRLALAGRTMAHSDERDTRAPRSRLE